ncbi:MAG TPA: hypothetical protein VGS41_17985, partial [Chthonomonadales bacterium]|nr:hypothetical protein [Chthonomonadales bacterium]
MRELKIGTSWVRGVVGEALNPELMVNFACAFGAWAEGKPVVIGRDTRASSQMLWSAVAAGLMSTGCEVIDLGVAPSPMVSFGVRELGAAGGICITGSHNDIRWNALKFVGPDGVLLNAARSEELLDIYHASGFQLACWNGLGPISGPYPSDRSGDLAARYVECVTSSLDVPAIRNRGFRVAIDFCNGACRSAVERTLSELGCTLLPLNQEATGRFAHAPAPGPANMSQLANFMRCIDADLGAAVNVDGDRIGFVAAAGAALSEEYALPLAAASRLPRREGPVVTSFSTSRTVDVVAAKYGRRVVRTAVGEGYVMDRALQEGACIAGEGSGGVAALPVTVTYDAVLTLGVVLESLALTGCSLQELVHELPDIHIRKGEIQCAPDCTYRALDGFRHRYSGALASLEDGVQA